MHFSHKLRMHLNQIVEEAFAGLVEKHCGQGVSFVRFKRFELLSIVRAHGRAETFKQGGTNADVVERGEVGGRVRVVVRYRAPTRVPLVGAFVDDVVLDAAATMRVER